MAQSTSLDSENNEKGSRAVKGTVPYGWAWVVVGRRTVATSVQRLLNQSLVLYLLFVVVARAWVLLNTDVTLLVRRIN